MHMAFEKYICFDLPTNLTAASVLNIYEYIMKPDANIYFPTRAHRIKLCTQINLENLKHQPLAPVFYALSRATFLFVCLHVCMFVVVASCNVFFYFDYMSAAKKNNSISIRIFISATFIYIFLLFIKHKKKDLKCDVMICKNKKP